VGASADPVDRLLALDAAVGRGDARDAARMADEAVRAGPFGPTAAAVERAIARFPDEAVLGDHLLELHRRFKDWTGFDATWRRLVARFPRRPELHFAAGRALEERGKACAAIRAYGRCARYDPDDLDAVIRISHVFRDAGRPFLARRRLRYALARHRDAPSLYAALAYAYVESGRHDRAITAFQAAVALEPADSPYLEELGVALLVVERWKRAAATAVKALRVRPEREKGWTVYAVAHRHLGNDAQAEKGYRNAVKYAREPGRARGNLGLFLAGRPGSAAEARDHLEAALDAHPEWDAVSEALSSLPPRGHDR
jgi:tetratricopeptide (TPR) repeat protein